MVSAQSSPYNKLFWNICIPISISIPIYLILSPVLLFFLLCRQGVIVLAKYISPGLKPFETGMDSIYTSEKLQDGSFNITGSLIVDKEITPQRIYQLFKERIFTLKNDNGEGTYQKLTQYCTSFLGYPFWATDKDFNLSNHVRDYDYGSVLRTPAPSDMSTLRAVLPKLMNLPWQDKQSHWEVLVVPNFSHQLGQSSCKTLLIFRFDHGITDGYSLVGVYRHLFGSPFKMPSLSRNNITLTLWRKCIILLTLPYETLEPFFSRPPSSPKEKYFKGQNLSDVTICDISETFSNSRIVTIKNEIGVAHASVTLGLISAAISQVFKKFRNLSPETLSMTSALPIANHPGGLCNHEVSCEFKLPCNRKSPIDHILRTDAMIKESSRSLSNFTMYYRVRLISILPLRFQRKFLSVCGIMGDGIDVTNFPCSLTPDFVDEGEIVDALFTVNPNCGIGILITTGSVNNRQLICFSMAENVFGTKIPSGFLSSTFLRELDELEEAVRSLKINEEKEKNKQIDGDMYLF